MKFYQLTIIMKKKIRNLKNGEVFEVTFPDGKKKHCCLTNVEALKFGKHTITIHRKDGDSLTLSNDDKVEIVFSGGKLPAGVHEAAKKALDDEIAKKGGNNVD